MKIVKKEVVVEARTDIVVELDIIDIDEIMEIIKSSWHEYVRRSKKVMITKYEYVIFGLPVITVITKFVNRAFEQGRQYERNQKH